MAASAIALANLATGIEWLAQTTGAVAVGQSRQVFVYVRGTTTPVTVYADGTLTSTLTQPLTTGTLTAGTPGGIPGYVPSGKSIDFVDVLSGDRAQGEALAAQDVVGSATGRIGDGNIPLSQSVVSDVSPTSTRLAFGQTASDERVLPSFTRYGGNPIFVASAATTPPPETATIYWPYVLNVGAIPGLTPVAPWYMYYSTDHAGDAGGIYLATASSPYGPWTPYSGGPQVFNDSTNGDQCENASVVWDEQALIFRMFYKLFTTVGASTFVQMVECLATSPDGINWTRVGQILELPQTNILQPGNQQVGYGRPFRVGSHWHMHLMQGGGNNPIWAHASSSDGATWVMDAQPLSYGVDELVDVAGATTPLAQNEIRYEMNSGDVLWWRDRLWWFGIISNFSSGSNAKNARLGCAPLRPDLRSLEGPCVYLLQPPTGANESYNYRSVHTHAYQGRLFMTYQCDQNFNLAVSN